LGGDEDDNDEDDLAAAVDLVLTTAELAAARLPAATLDAVGPGGTACPDDARSAAVATPAAHGRQHASTAAAAVAERTPPAVAAARR